MGCEMSKALNHNDIKAPVALNPREVTMITLYPENDGYFFEVNALAKASNAADRFEESPSRLFLPDSTESTPKKTVQISTDPDSLNIDIPDISSNDDFNEEDEECMSIASKKDQFISVQQHLLPPCSPLKSTNSGVMMNAVVNLVVRPNSGRFSENFLQGRSIFQSPLRKLSHPFDFAAQYSPKVTGNFQSKYTFESLQ